MFAGASAGGAMLTGMGHRPLGPNKVLRAAQQPVAESAGTKTGGGGERVSWLQQSVRALQRGTQALQGSLCAQLLRTARCHH